MTRTGNNKNAYKNLASIHNGKRPSVRPRRRCEDFECTSRSTRDVNWTHLAPDRERLRDIVNTEMDLGFP